MSREIKFRFYDPFNKVMQYCSMEYKDYLSKFFIEYCNALEGENNPVLMQYTGLLDKNGKEIYEGDIFEFDYPMEVLWDMGSWVVKTKKGSSLLFGYTTEGEIIGNIYENPELLDNPKSK